MLGRRHADFSLSGLKTTLRLEAEKIAPLQRQDVRDLCAAFQQAWSTSSPTGCAPAWRCSATATAADRAGRCQRGGGQRGAAQGAAPRRRRAGTVLVVPPAALCTDNGAMIAWAGAERLALGLTDTLDAHSAARWPLSDVTGPPHAAGAARAPPPPAAHGDAAAAESRFAIPSTTSRRRRRCLGHALANVIARAGRRAAAGARDRAGADARRSGARARACPEPARDRVGVAPAGAEIGRSTRPARRPGAAAARGRRAIAPLWRQGTP